MSKLIKIFLVPQLIIALSIAGLERLSLASPQGSAALMPSHMRDTRLLPERADRDLSKIISVLESRIKNHQLPARAKDKLAAMNDEDIRLVTLLCDRMSGTGETAGADLALMLATALIVLS